MIILFISILVITIAVLVFFLTRKKSEIPINPPVPIVDKSIYLDDLFNYLKNTFPKDDNYGSIIDGYVPKEDGVLITPNWYGPSIDEYNIKIKNPTKIYPFSPMTLKPDTDAYKIPLYIYTMIVSAESSVDIVGLYTFPDGTWLDAISSGLQVLDKKNKPITIRLFYGVYKYNIESELKKLLNDISKNLNENTKLKIIAGQAHSPYSLTWNHAKILNIDGKTILTGGQNWWETDYLLENPVMDINIIVKGNNYMATKYANQKWNELYNAITCKGISCKNNLQNHGYVFKNRNIIKLSDIDKIEFSSYLLPEIKDDTTKYGNEYFATKILPIFKNYNPKDEIDVSEAARIYSIKNAKKRVYISQQSIESIISEFEVVSKTFSDKYFDRLVDAISTSLYNGAEVNIITSVYTNIITLPIYSYRASEKLIYLYNKINEYFKNKGWDMKIISNNFKQKYCSYDNKTGAFQHDKFWLVDNFFYVGSHNIYYSKLSQFGVMCQDPELIDSILNSYWYPKWQNGIIP